MDNLPEPARPTPTEAPATPPDTVETGQGAVPTATVRGAVATIRAATDRLVTFTTFTARIAAITTSALRLKDQMHTLIAETEHNADTARALAEMCTSAGVEPQFTALIHESSTALHGVVTAARDVIETADRTEVDARTLQDAHEKEYRGIYEAVQASGVQQPKAGFNAVR